MILTNIKSLIGIIPKPHSYKKGEALRLVEQIDNAYLVIENGLISNYGPMSDYQPSTHEEVDCTDALVLPAWCDSHTHLVYAASREEEFVMRIEGRSYEEIAESGGGILNSANKLRALPQAALYESAALRLESVISMGTGAIEIKSGYGLSFDSEVKMLRVVQQLKENYPVKIKSNFLGAHAIPLEFKNNREGYIDLIINEMLPYVAGEGLADYCDVFCDKGFYTVEETDQILSAAAKYGLKGKIHANELANSGGVQVGIKNNAVSVDHLESIGPAEIEALKNSSTIPTLLPSCSFFLNIPYAPAREMIDAGLGVTIATDFNPGTTPSGNIPFLLSLACLKLRMVPNEAFNAITINGAYAMEIEDNYGSITKGKVANLIITKPIPNLAYIPYNFGENSIDRVIINGQFA